MNTFDLAKGFLKVCILLNKQVHAKVLQSGNSRLQGADLVQERDGQSIVIGVHIVECSYAERPA